MKHYETTGYGYIKVNDYPKGWFGTKEITEKQGIYTCFRKAKAREVSDIKREIARQKEYLKEIREFKNVSKSTLLVQFQPEMCDLTNLTGKHNDTPPNANA